MPSNSDPKFGTGSPPRCASNGNILFPSQIGNQSPSSISGRRPYTKRLTLLFASPAPAAAPRIRGQLARNTSVSATLLICEFAKICREAAFDDPFVRSPACSNRALCRSLAANTRARISSDPSAAVPPRNSLYCTAGTSIWMSIRSSSGPDTFETYLWIIGGVHIHSRDLSLKYPQGHGFIAAASMNLAGKFKLIAARAIVTVPSSSG